MKWFELLRQQYNCETIMFHTPYLADGKITKDMIKYMVKQLKQDVIPKLEKVSGVKFDIDLLREFLRKSAVAEDDLVWVLQSAKTKPSPIDAYFGGIYYIGPIFGAFRGTDDAIDYYRFLRQEVEERIAEGKGPVTPDGDMGQERYRLVVEGPPNYTHFRQFWKMFYDEGAVVVASSYTKVGGTYDFGFRHDPDNPLESSGGILPECLHQPQSADAGGHAGELHRRIPGRRAADQFDQKLQQLLGRPVADHAGSRESAPASQRRSSKRTSSIRGISRPPTSRTGWKAISR